MNRTAAYVLKEEIKHIQLKIAAEERNMKSAKDIMQVGEDKIRLMRKEISELQEALNGL